MKDETLQAVQACHEFLLWLIPQLDKFPRMRRLTLGDRLELGLLEVLELRVVSTCRYEYGAKQMEELGRQVGGWLCSSRQRESPS